MSGTSIIAQIFVHYPGSSKIVISHRNLHRSVAVPCCLLTATKPPSMVKKTTNPFSGLLLSIPVLFKTNFSSHGLQKSDEKRKIDNIQSIFVPEFIN